MERAQKFDLLARATPLPPAVYLAAKITVGMLFALLSVLILFAYGTAVGGIRLPPAVWVGAVGRLLAGSLPLIALGFTIGYTAGPHAAPAVA
ncbi:MAG TPA: ABC transporter permease, partial [Candidatus Binatia bacterium]|nr:ABC transporter permease [Candidatus Binatia bacterium]